VRQLAPGEDGARDEGVAQRGDLVGERDVEHRGARRDDPAAQLALARLVVLDRAVLAERVDHPRDLVAELRAHVVDRARRVLDDVVQQRDELDVLVAAGGAEHVGDRLRVRQALAGPRADASVCLDDKLDRVRPADLMIERGGLHSDTC
jgi:hypothetical protein